MLKLKDVSKFYYNKGVIASGFNRVSTEFNIGEFVVITGESGSGKSTLLNVVSGLDTYEEGEMYINGAETSHYGEGEFEDYRKKYIGNIFQNFNLVNSYTVYQNVELILLINGYKKREIKEKVLAILKQVDLYKFRKTKVSKLSGGQKQRVAIARVLAKESPIIVADEPTGSLDSRSAASVLETLSKIAQDKLVIIVTHNYDQVEKYATRKIKMHDGRIIEDKVLKKTSLDLLPAESHYQNITNFSKLRLGLRNTFNVIPKFLLIFFVYFFIVAALLGEYSSFKKEEYENSKTGYNGYFQDTTDSRIIIKKLDGSYLTNDDYQKIGNLANVSYIVKDDLILDSSASLSNNKELYLYGLVKDLALFEGGLDLGRMPENDKEIILMGNPDDYYMNNAKENLVGQELYLVNNYSGEINQNVKLKVVGIKYYENSRDWNYRFYVQEEVLVAVKESYNQYYSEIKVSLGGKEYTTSYWNTQLQITPNNKVPAGSAYMSEELNYYCTNYNCLNKKIGITNTNIYYRVSKELKITKLYNNNNFTKLTGLKSYLDHFGRIFVNPTDYKNLYDKNQYQSSVFVSDVRSIDETVQGLKDLGFTTLKVKDTLVNYDAEFAQVIKIVKLVVTIIIVVVMFFISYFIIKLILKSRNVYFSTIRILGASKKVAKRLLDIELFVIANISYWLIIGFMSLVQLGLIKYTYIKDLMRYLRPTDYIITYVILLCMSQLIANKFAKSLFKKSAMKTYFEEV